VDDVERFFPDAVRQVAGEIFISFHDILNFIGHLIEMIGQMSPFVPADNGNAFDVAPFLKFIDGFDDHFQRPADQPAVAYAEQQKNGQQKSRAADQQELPGAAHNFRVGPRKSNDAHHNAGVPRVSGNRIKQAQRRSSFRF